ncbi:hypothetical protein [Oceanospirillum sp.]|uniref:hypothetical protein n=1 Tax=Oceanospirillum sp. TaxID=2021254 RepID=UPI003A948461
MIFKKINEVDGYLTDGVGNKFQAVVQYTEPNPISGSEINIFFTSDFVPKKWLPTPIGFLSSNSDIYLENIFFRRIPCGMPLGRKYGAFEADVRMVDKITKTETYGSSPSLSMFFSRNNLLYSIYNTYFPHLGDFQNLKRILIKDIDISGRNFSLSIECIGIPESCGKISYYSYYTFDCNSPYINDDWLISHREEVDGIKIIMSLFARQMTKFNGYRYTSDEKHVTQIKDPTGIKDAEFPHNENNSEQFEYLVNSSAIFEEKFPQAVSGYLDLDKEIRYSIKKLIAAINPHVRMSDAQHFFFMFSVLEDFAVGWFRSTVEHTFAESENSAFYTKLQGVFSDLSGFEKRERQRIKGFMSGVRKNSKSSKKKVEDFLKDHALTVHDLLPLLDEDIGLYTLRDKIGHGVSDEIDGQLMATAVSHARVLLERVCLKFLNVPIEGTSVDPRLLQRDMFFDPLYLQTLKQDE